ncbi:GNAT family N-acetyltransferase [Egicoccus halophilus]|uniref:N-acetyltransferase domain-containing protein n=1 Tax=Egicoccus halophilus TaxID=1670830 RepID=A0A8J3AF89_9ACTN|nr:GNAT family N-acetyltransferase [Egicoccus halophilus]GGI07746.1 hypothetical protein GCM10011354_25630 [Egicoccus halophilus]
MRPASRRDLRSTARLHRDQLPDGFFARLGPGFLRTYHATFRRSPDAIAIVTGEPGRPGGFLVGTLDNRTHYRFVVRRCAWRLALRGLLALLARPRMGWLFVRTRALHYARWVVRYPLQRLRGADGGAEAPDATPDTAASGSDPVPDVAGDATDDAGGTAAAGDPDESPAHRIAVLTHVAVDPVRQGGGEGRALVEAFVSAAREAGASEARLVTKAGGGAEAFYDRLGWVAGARRPGSGGESVREYRLDLREHV